MGGEACPGHGADTAVPGQAGDHPQRSGSDCCCAVMRPGPMKGVVPCGSHISWELLSPVVEMPRNGTFRCRSASWKCKVAASRQGSVMLMRPPSYAVAVPIHTPEISDSALNAHFLVSGSYLGLPSRWARTT